MTQKLFQISVTQGMLANNKKPITKTSTYALATSVSGRRHAPAFNVQPHPARSTATTSTIKATGDALSALTSRLQRGTKSDLVDADVTVITPMADLAGYISMLRNEAQEKSLDGSNDNHPQSYEEMRKAYRRTRSTISQLGKTPSDERNVQISKIKLEINRLTAKKSDQQESPASYVHRYLKWADSSRNNNTPQKELKRLEKAMAKIEETLNTPEEVLNVFANDEIADQYARKQRQPKEELVRYLELSAELAYLNHEQDTLQKLTQEEANLEKRMKRAATLAQKKPSAKTVKELSTEANTALLESYENAVKAGLRIHFAQAQLPFELSAEEMSAVINKPAHTTQKENTLSSDPKAVARRVRRRKTPPSNAVKHQTEEAAQRREQAKIAKINELEALKEAAKNGTLETVEIEDEPETVIKPNELQTVHVYIASQAYSKTQAAKKAFDKALNSAEKIPFIHGLSSAELRDIQKATKARMENPHNEQSYEEAFELTANVNFPEYIENAEKRLNDAQRGFMKAQQREKDVIGYSWHIKAEDEAAINDKGIYKHASRNGSMIQSLTEALESTELTGKHVIIHSDDTDFMTLLPLEGDHCNDSERRHDFMSDSSRDLKEALSTLEYTLHNLQVNQRCAIDVIAHDAASLEALSANDKAALDVEAHQKQLFKTKRAVSDHLKAMMRSANRDAKTITPLTSEQVIHVVSNSPHNNGQFH